MNRKRISRKYRDLIHLAIFLLVLILFANYEANRKTDIATAIIRADKTVPFNSGNPVDNRITGSSAHFSNW